MAGNKRPHSGIDSSTPVIPGTIQPSAGTQGSGGLSTSHVQGGKGLGTQDAAFNLIAQWHHMNGDYNYPFDGNGQPRYDKYGNGHPFGVTVQNGDQATKHSAANEKPATTAVNGQPVVVKHPLPERLQAAEKIASKQIAIDLTNRSLTVTSIDRAVHQIEETIDTTKDARKKYEDILNKAAYNSGQALDGPTKDQCFELLKVAQGLDDFNKENKKLAPEAKLAKYNALIAVEQEILMDSGVQRVLQEFTANPAATPAAATPTPTPAPKVR